MAYFATTIIIMPDYEKIRRQYHLNDDLSYQIIDDFLIDYAGEKDKLDKEFEARMVKYKKPAALRGKLWVSMLRMQYIGHRIFKQQGLIHKYLKHSALKTLTPKEQQYLQVQAKTPWRFSFCVILSNPEEDFYEMEDVFNGERFLLCSEAIGLTLKQHPAISWMILIGDQGDFWETYGPVVGFQCLTADDIFFFAQELNNDIEDNDGLLTDLESNPIPYMMLAIGEKFPLKIVEGHELVELTGEGEVTTKIDRSVFEKYLVQEERGLYKIIHPFFSQPPHAAKAYYDEVINYSFLISCTDYGYREFAKELNGFGMNLPEEADTRVHLPMFSLIEHILQKEVDNDPYHHVFSIANNYNKLEKLNQFLEVLIAEYKAGKQPDVEQLIKETGADPEAARELLRRAEEDPQILFD